MCTDIARPDRVVIIGASGTYGSGILARTEEIGVEAVVVTRSPHKFREPKPTTRVVETQLDEEQTLKEAFRGCDAVLSALGDDRKERPKTRYLPHVWKAMKAVGVTKYIGMASGAMTMPGEIRGGFQRAVHPLLSILKLFGIDMLEQNEWERDSLLAGRNGADGITWVITRVVRPTWTPCVGAYAHRDKRGPLNCSIYDHGDFCLYCAASSEWDGLAPHVSSGLGITNATRKENSVMTANLTLKTTVAAMLLLMIASLAQAFEWSGHVGLLAGGKILDDRDWPQMDEHYSLGFIADLREASWPIGIALDVMDTGGKHDHDGMEDLGHTAEIHLGVRKIFLGQDRKMQPYIGGGVAFMFAEQEYEIESIKTKEDDGGVGTWFGVGTYYDVHPRFVLGLDARYSRGEVSLFDEDRDAGGPHAYITAGFKF